MAKLDGRPTSPPEEMAPTQIGVVSITLAPFKPSRRLRLAGITSPTAASVFFDLRFAASDDSVYLAPQLSTSYFFSGTDHTGGRFAEKISPGGDFHLSLHKSGIVNITAGGSSFRVRGAATEVPPLGRLVRIAANPDANFKQVSFEDLNRGFRKTEVLPTIPSLGPGTFGLDIFRHDPGARWTLPALADVTMFDLALAVRGRQWIYHLVSWYSTTRMPSHISLAITA